MVREESVWISWLMEAIILAGGLGTRLRQVVSDLPKPMAPIAGRPFLEILLTFLARVILSVGFMSGKIVEHFGAQYAGMALVYEVEREPLGTGGAIRAALTRCLDDHVFVFNGDTYCDLDVDGLERTWQHSRGPIVVVREVSDTARFGRVEIAGERIAAFREKGVSGTGMINAGCTCAECFPSGSKILLGNGISCKRSGPDLLHGLYHSRVFHRYRSA
jgi:D-glycero-alpha-D-manno-heptose 1-phosphate guanylyltransferase